MATSTLKVSAREHVGKRAMKKLRAAGMIPANLYGHGQPNVNLAVSADDVNAIIRQGAHLVQLQGAAHASALIKDVQWDMMGSTINHLDLTRTDASELVESTLEVELRGEAPGGRNGGIVEQPVHSVRIRCPAGKIPDRLILSVNGLELEMSLTAGDIPLPDGAELLTDDHEMVVHCVPPVEEVEESTAATGAEPEVIGRKREDEAETE